MPYFGTQSQKRLDECHPELQLLMNIVITEWDCSILCGYRNQAEQQRMVVERKSRVNFPMSKHNCKPAMAVDAVPYPIDWKNRERFIGFGCYVLGIADRLFAEGKMKHRVRWGGDWHHIDREFTPQTFNDLPHFELVTA